MAELLVPTERHFEPRKAIARHAAESQISKNRVQELMQENARLREKLSSQQTKLEAEIFTRQNWKADQLQKFEKAYVKLEENGDITIRTGTNDDPKTSFQGKKNPGSVGR